MSTYPDFPDTLMVTYRSEAFAEDLEDLQRTVRRRKSRRSGSRLLRAGWTSWLFMLPLAAALLGSVSALA